MDSTRLYIYGGLLKRGVPVIIHLNRIFHQKNDSYWGTPMTSETSICMYIYITTIYPLHNPYITTNHYITII